MKKRSQIERLTIARSLVKTILEEVYNGNAEDVFQLAVDIQLDINMLVLELMRRKNAEIH